MAWINMCLPDNWTEDAYDDLGKIYSTGCVDSTLAGVRDMLIDFRDITNGYR